MPTIGSITKTIRISPGDLEIIEGIMSAENLSWSGAIHRLISENGSAGTPTTELPYGIDMADLDDLKTMVGFGCGSVGEIIHLIDKGLNDGSLVLESGRIIGRPEVDLDKFLDVCHDFGKDPQKMLDKMIEKIRR